MLARARTSRRTRTPVTTVALVRRVVGRRAVGALGRVIVRAAGGRGRRSEIAQVAEQLSARPWRFPGGLFARGAPGQLPNVLSIGLWVRLQQRAHRVRLLRQQACGQTFQPMLLTRRRPASGGKPVQRGGDFAHRIRRGGGSGGSGGLVGSAPVPTGGEFAFLQLAQLFADELQLAFVPAARADAARLVDRGAQICRQRDSVELRRAERRQPRAEIDQRPGVAFPPAFAEAGAAVAAAVIVTVAVVAVMFAFVPVLVFVV